MPLPFRRPLAVLAVGALFAGCQPPDSDVADITFDPPVDDRGNATIDLGDVAVGTNPPPAATIQVFNNTDAEVTVGVDCDDIVGTPFNISCPAALTLPESGSTDGTGAANNTGAVGGTLLAGPNDIGAVSASIFFDYNDRIYVFALTANVTN